MNRHLNHEQACVAKRIEASSDQFAHLFPNGASVRAITSVLDLVGLTARETLSYLEWQEIGEALFWEARWRLWRVEAFQTELERARKRDHKPAAPAPAPAPKPDTAPAPVDEVPERIRITKGPTIHDLLFFHRAWTCDISQLDFVSIEWWEVVFDEHLMHHYFRHPAGNSSCPWTFGAMLDKIGEFHGNPQGARIGRDFLKQLWLPDDIATDDDLSEMLRDGMSEGGSPGSAGNAFIRKFVEPYMRDAVMGSPLVPKWKRSPSFLDAWPKELDGCCEYPWHPKIVNIVPFWPNSTAGDLVDAILSWPLAAARKS